MLRILRTGVGHPSAGFDEFCILLNDILRLYGFNITHKVRDEAR